MSMAINSKKPEIEENKATVTSKKSDQQLNVVPVNVSLSALLEKFNENNKKHI